MFGYLAKVLEAIGIFFKKTFKVKFQAERVLRLKKNHKLKRKSTPKLC